MSTWQPTPAAMTDLVLTQERRPPVDSIATAAGVRTVPFTLPTITRMTTSPVPAYVEKRRAERRTAKKTQRCLNRHFVHQIYRLLTPDTSLTKPDKHRRDHSPP